jgi:hypothetical protein
MQRENLEKRNKKWMGKIYREKIKEYSRMQNIGFYKLLSVDDLINDAYVTFITYNDLGEFDGTYEHLSNRFNQFIYWQQTASYNSRSKKVQQWMKTSHLSEYTFDDDEREMSINSKNLRTTPYPEMIDLENELAKNKYQLLRFSLAGYTGEEIGYLLGFSHTTINTHVKNQREDLKQKLFGDVKVGSVKKKNKYYDYVKGNSKKTKKVIDTETGIIYKSAKDAYEKNKYLQKRPYGALTKMLRGVFNNNTTLKYVDQTVDVTK